MPVININNPPDLNKSFVSWNNYVPASTITANGSVAGFPPINVSDPATYNSWKAPSAAAARINFDLGSVRTISTVCIAAHDMATVGAGVQLLVSDDGVSYTELSYHTPTTNEEIIFNFAPQSRRYVSLNFNLAAPSIGVVFISDRLTFPCTPVDGYKPTHHARKYTKMFNSSIRGQFLGNRVMGAGGETEVQFPSIPRDFVDGPLRGFENWYNRGNTFFYAGWPGGKPVDCAYCRAIGDEDTVDVSYVNGAKLATLSFGIQTYVGV